MSARAAPHLPFLAGPPEFTVGLRPIPPERWLKPDWEAASIPAKRALLDQRAEETFRILPIGTAAAEEAGRLVAEAFGARPAEGGAFAAAARLVSDDLVIMVDDAGAWRVGAAALCSPSFFSLEDAVGETLAGLHEPVPDRLGPDGAQGLGARIARVFTGLQVSQVLERFNWTLQAGDARFTPTGQPMRALAAAAHGADDAKRLLYLRVERQTIAKLTMSGAVLFTIRVSLDPLAPILEESNARAAFVRAWREAPAHLRRYKRWAALEHLTEALIAPD